MKDDEALREQQTASQLTVALLNKVFIKQMESVIDEEKEITHVKLAETLENALYDKDVKRRLRLSDTIRTDLSDWCYSPIIQSGGAYDLKPSAISNEDKLHFGTILCSMGVRYRSYCSNVARTFLIEPTKQQERNYEFLMDLQAVVLRAMHVGTKLSAVYEAAVAHIRNKRPDLESAFVKNCGFGMGIEFRESLFVINEKNTRELTAGMVFNVVLGFQGLDNPDADDPRARTYALLLADTVQVRDGADSISLTNAASKEFKDVTYCIKAQEEQTEEKGVRAAAAKPAAGEGDVAGPKELRSRAKSEGAAADDTASREKQRQGHQKELAAQKQREGVARFSGPGGAGAADGADEQPLMVRQFESYASPAAMPREARTTTKIVIDKKNESVILPIAGYSVPFHISTIKNVAKNDEGDYSFLRINFVTPGVVFGKKESVMPFADPNATFIRELTYRSVDARSMAEVFRLIKELRKRVTESEAEKREKEDLVEQDALIVTKGGRPVPRLTDVAARPALAAGKRASGTLEAHTNGLRYQSMKGDKIDLLYSNIKHLFFQPCDKELIVLLHCHLKHPIMIGKKKTYDVQFVREVLDASYDDTGARRKGDFFDKDELEAEQEERRRRKALNKEFKTFAEKINELSEGVIEVDVPFRDLGFPGVPFRSTVLLQPTTYCLVQLTDVPVFILTLSDVEIAHFERIQFGLKNFDLVFVFRDFKRAPVHINSIPMTFLEAVKDWLDSVDVAFSEGPANLNWNAIMKHINSDPAAFFAEGGWGFLQDQESDEAGEDDEEEESEESEYAPEGDGSEDESESEYSEEDDDEEDDESEFEEEEDDESGKDWSDLEEEAREADRKRGGAREASVSPVRNKRGRGGSSGSEEDRRPSKKSSGMAKKPVPAKGKVPQRR